MYDSVCFFAGQGAAVKLLVARGANVDCADVFERTPLMTAAWRGHVEIASMLLEAGCSARFADALTNLRHTPERARPVERARPRFQTEILRGLSLSLSLSRVCARL